MFHLGHGPHVLRRTDPQGNRTGRYPERARGFLLRSTRVGDTPVLLVPGVHKVPPVTAHTVAARVHGNRRQR